MLVDLLCELQSRIVAELSLAIVHSRNFQNDRQVTTGGNGNCVHGNLDTQDFGVLVLQAQAVIDLMVVPGDDVHNQIDLVINLNCTHTEKLCHIDDADAAQFHVIPDQLGCGTDKGGAGNFTDFHSIVRDQTVAALQKFHGVLTLTNRCVLFPPICMIEAEENNKDNIEYKSKVLEILNEYK